MPASTESPDDSARRAALLTAVYLAVVLAGVWHHELWRDEWQAWMLARDSESFLEFIRSLGYEGHLPAWYGLLFLLGRLTRDPVAMQAAHVAIATGSVYLLGRYSPFPWTLKVLAVFGYFLAYEYAVLARPYALAVFALFLFCASFSGGPRRRWGVPLALGLLALSSMYGLILAAAAVGMLLLRRATVTPSTRVDHERRALGRGGLLVWSVVVGGVALILLNHPFNFLIGVPGANQLPLLSRWGIASTLGTVGEAYLPLPELLDAHPRETHFIGADSTLELGLLAGLSVLVVCAAVLMFARRTSVLFFYLAGTSGLLLFSHLVFRGFIRHHGHLFLLFLACLWLAWDPPDRASRDSRTRWTGTGAGWVRMLVTLVLLVQVAAAGVLYAHDLTRPFSVAGEVADLLRAEGIDDLPIFASPGPPASSVAGELDRPIYYLGTRSAGTFISWSHFVRGRDRNFNMEHLRRFLGEHGPEVLVILGRPHDEWDEDLDVEEIARFDAGIEQTERYVVYRVVERPSARSEYRRRNLAFHSGMRSYWWTMQYSSPAGVRTSSPSRTGGGDSIAASRERR